ncbi:uncharacterized protein LOC129619078 [Condylostylus longicornis]|uniref:uncharacterized protein LOC129619078 n=1 Tax=Condylostylus longicornis TaxID=2530218 RepID=UPI00244D9A28|nr:uncharacterized protein LOC129619078 [Condylostylus longicornis]
MENLNFNEIFPIEIKLHIFSYLNFGDIIAISTVCKEWLEITKMDDFQNKISIRFSGVYLSDIKEPASLFLNKTRPFRNLILKDCEMEYCNNFLKTMGSTLKSITFELCNKMSPIHFITIIDNIENLKELSIKNWWGFEKFELLDTNDNNSKILYLNYIEREKHALSKLEKLHLHVKNSSAFQEIAVRLTEVNELTLKDIYFDFSGPMPLHKTYVWYNLLMLDKLNLKRFELNGHFFPSEEFFQFLIRQKNLKELHLRGLHYLHDEQVDLIANNLEFLEVLKVPFCYHVSNRSLESLLKLKYLKKLEISNSVQHEAGIDDVVTDEGIQRTIARQNNDRLLELSLGSIKLCDKQMSLIVPKLKNLTSLDIEASDIDNDKITDESIQIIIKNLKWLKNLNLKNNIMITDYGLTGLNQLSNIVDGVPISNLKGLISLNLKNCNKLTDISLIHGIKFLELRQLSIGELPSYKMIDNTLVFINSTNFTENGFKALAKNCPSLENLNFSTNNWNYLATLSIFPRLTQYIMYKNCIKCERTLQFNSIDRRHVCIMCNVNVD